MKMGAVYSQAASYAREDHHDTASGMRHATMLDEHSCQACTRKEHSPLLTMRTPMFLATFATASFALMPIASMTEITAQEMPTPTTATTSFSLARCDERTSQLKVEQERRRAEADSRKAEAKAKSEARKAEMQAKGSPSAEQEAFRSAVQAAQSVRAAALDAARTARRDAIDAAFEVWAARCGLEEAERKAAHVTFQEALKTAMLSFQAAVKTANETFTSAVKAAKEARQSTMASSRSSVGSTTTERPMSRRFLQPAKKGPMPLRTLQKSSASSSSTSSAE